MKKNGSILYVIIACLVFSLQVPLIAQPSEVQSLQQQKKTISDAYRDFKKLYKKCNSPQGCSVEERRKLRQQLAVIGMAVTGLLVVIGFGLFKSYQGWRKVRGYRMEKTQQPLSTVQPRPISEAERVQAQQDFEKKIKSIPGMQQIEELQKFEEQGRPRGGFELEEDEEAMLQASQAYKLQMEQAAQRLKEKESKKSSEN